MFQTQSNLYSQVFNQPAHAYILSALAVVRLVSCLYLLFTVLEHILPEWPRRIPMTVSSAVLVAVDMTVLASAEKLASGILVVLCCGLIEINRSLAEVQAGPEIDPVARTP